MLGKDIIEFFENNTSYHKYVLIISRWTYFKDRIFLDFDYPVGPELVWVHEDRIIQVILDEYKNRRMRSLYE